MVNPGTTYIGPYGTAQQLPPTDDPRGGAQVDAWLLTCPRFHPVWYQYAIGVIRLGDVPGLPPARHIQFDGATHELLLVALNPEHGPQTAESTSAGMVDGSLPYLEPVNVVHQFEATDDEMRHVMRLAVQAVTRGILTPETGDAPTAVREAWLASLTKTLAHLRGEAHAS